MRPPIEQLLRRRSIDTEELRSLATDQGSYWEYGTEASFELDAPIHFEELPREITEKIGHFAIDQPFVAELRDVELVGPKPIVIADDGRYLLEQSLRSPPLLLRGLVATLASGKTPARRSARASTTDVETAVPLVGPWNRGFFHWFSEWFPRLEGVRRYERATGRSPTLLIPADPPQWMTESLELIGYDPDDWLEWHGGRARFDRMVVPSLRRARGVSDGTRGYVVPPGAYRWVREQLLDAVSPSRSGGGRRILIPRDDAEERRLTNIDAVASAVEGLEVLTLSGRSLEEQIRLFADAELVVGPHGAGFTNLIYAENPLAVEAFGDFVNACYFTLSEGLGYRYAYLRGESRGADISIDPAALTTLIEMARE